MDRQLYRCDMTDEQHEKLLQALLKVKGKVMLCGYKSHCYSKYLKGWKRIEFPTTASMSPKSKKPQRTEVIWMNYDLSEEQMAEALQPKAPKPKPKTPKQSLPKPKAEKPKTPKSLPATIPMSESPLQKVRTLRHRPRIVGWYRPTAEDDYHNDSGRKRWRYYSLFSSWPWRAWKVQNHSGCSQGSSPGEDLEFGYVCKGIGGETTRFPRLHPFL